jgi:hypothetical protein
MTTLRLRAGHSADGETVFEEVLAESHGGICFKLLRSPGLVLGLAAGDLFDYQRGGSFRVIRRSGNIAIQIFVERDVAHVEKQASALLGPLGASLDGKCPGQLVFTVPVAVGFPRIEAALDEAIARCASAAEWYFGNVYDPADGVTPLDWWLEERNTLC